MILYASVRSCLCVTNAAGHEAPGLDGGWSNIIPRPHACMPAFTRPWLFAHLLLHHTTLTTTYCNYTAKETSSSAALHPRFADTISDHALLIRLLRAVSDFSISISTEHQPTVPDCRARCDDRPTVSTQGDERRRSTCRCTGHSSSACTPIPLIHKERSTSSPPSYTFDAAYVSLSVAGTTKG